MKSHGVWEIKKMKKKRVFTLHGLTHIFCGFADQFQFDCINTMTWQKRKDGKTEHLTFKFATPVEWKGRIFSEAALKITFFMIFEVGGGGRSSIHILLCFPSFHSWEDENSHIHPHRGNPFIPSQNIMQHTHTRTHAHTHTHAKHSLKLSASPQHILHPTTLTRSCPLHNKRRFITRTHEIKASTCLWHAGFGAE